MIQLPRTQTRRLTLCALALAARLFVTLTTPGCAGTHGSGAAHGGAKGVLAEIAAPGDTVFRACVLALQMEGYTIDVQEPTTGIVVTRLKPVPAAERSAAGAKSYRAYVVEVKGAPGGKVHVIATPTQAAPAAAGARPGWDPEHERAERARLFDDVRALVEREQTD